MANGKYRFSLDGETAEPSHGKMGGKKASPHGKISRIEASDEHPGHVSVTVKHPQLNKKKGGKSDGIGYTPDSRMLLPHHAAQGLKVGQAVQMGLTPCDDDNDEDDNY